MPGYPAQAKAALFLDGIVRIGLKKVGSAGALVALSAPAAHYSSASYAAIVAYALSVSKWLPFFGPPWIALSA